MVHRLMWVPFISLKRSSNCLPALALAPRPLCTMTRLAVCLLFTLFSASACSNDPPEEVSSVNESLDDHDDHDFSPSARRRRSTHETITLHGLVAGGTQDAILTYPKTPYPGHKYPLITFAHGTDVGPASYQKLMDTVSQEGFIVVAVGSCPRGECKTGWKDVVKAIEVCKDGTAHPRGKQGEKVEALKHVDFNSVGIFGHSMGGGYVTAIATDGGYNIKCGASLHGASCGSYHKQAPKVPMLYTAGSTDRIIPAWYVKKIEASCKSKCKYHEVAGGHYPISSGEAEYVAKYLKACVGNGGSTRRRRSTEANRTIVV